MNFHRLALALEVLMGVMSCCVAVLLFVRGEVLGGVVLGLMALMFAIRLWLIVKLHREPLTLDRRR